MSEHFIFDAESRHQHYLERFKTGEVNKLTSFLKRVEESLILQLSKAQTFRSQKRIREILTRIQADSELFLTEYVEQLSLDLEDFGESEAEFTAATLTKDSDLDFTTPAVTQIAAAVNARPFNSKLLKDELKDFSKGQAKFIRNSVAMGFAEGRTNQEIVKDVIGSQELKFKDGSMQVTRNAASRMVRTAIQHTAAVAKSEVYKDNDDLIDKYAWVSTLDSRTCLLPDQKVLMANGDYKEIAKITTGDHVIGKSGKPREVIGALNSHVKQVLHVTLETGKIISCTGDHLWLTHNKGWVEAQDLTTEDDIVELSDLPKRNKK